MTSTAELICSACGSQNPQDARFCAQCGARLAGVVEDAAGEVDSTSTITFGSREITETAERPLDPVDAAAVDALPAGHALLVVQRGPGAGSRFLLADDLVEAGRHPDSDIFLDDVTVSRKHAEFARSLNDFRVRDVGSLNGTYVNRDRIEDVPLQDGDEVQIGKYRLVFFAGQVGS
jgi:pSer/pThr/pTyr-binding forkhead associated (FHA) protein